MTKSLEDRIQLIEERNKRVEADKAWEGSWTRKVSIMLMTYLVVAAYLRFVVQIDPWINAIVPVLGFVLSTLTISLLKSYWINRRDSK